MKKTQAALSSVNTISTAEDTDGDGHDSEQGPFKNVSEKLRLKREELSMQDMKEMDPYMNEFGKNTQFFTDLHPNVVEYGLTEYIKTRNFTYGSDATPKVSQKKYKYTFDVTTGFKAIKQVTQVCVRILKVQDKKYCVDFSMTAGGSYEVFVETYKLLIRSKDIRFAIQ